MSISKIMQYYSNISSITKFLYIMYQYSIYRGFMFIKQTNSIFNDTILCYAWHPEKWESLNLFLEFDIYFIL